MHKWWRSPITPHPSGLPTIYVGPLSWSPNTLSPVPPTVFCLGAFVLAVAISVRPLRSCSWFEPFLAVLHPQYRQGPAQVSLLKRLSLLPYIFLVLLYTDTHPTVGDLFLSHLYHRDCVPWSSSRVATAVPLSDPMLARYLAS